MTQFVIPNADPIATLTFEDVVTVDISSFTNAGDYISLSLPEFPRTKITVAESYVDFTSNAKGDFGAGPTDSIKFSEASPALPAVAGDTEMRIPISLLKTINKAELSGVRFRIKASEECTFRCLSIRACAEDWKYSPIDLDTLWHRVKRPPTPNGTLGNRTNLYPNPSGEKVIKMTAPESGEWVGTRELGTASIPAFAGEYRDKYEKTASGSRIAVETFKFPGAGTYVMSMYVFLNPEWDGEKVRINFGNDFTKESETVLQESDLTKKGQWQQISTLVVVGSAKLVATFELMTASSKPSSGSKSVIFTDALMVEQASVAGTYFDGSFLGSSWTGTANASSSIAPFSAFPADDIEGLFPRLFRSAETFGITDPEPVNLEVAAVFNAGSFGQAKGGLFNKFAMIFRDYPEDDQTMVEVNSFNQAQLDGLGKQPDFGKALYDARDQADVDLEIQAELDTSTQFVVERKRDDSEHSWIEVLLEWNATTANNKLHIWDADQVGYTFEAIPIEASEATELNKGKYALIVNMENSTLQVKIYKVDQVGNLTSKVYDTGVIRDETIFKRRKGRFGWQANLQDGDAYIESIKSRGANYGEVISKEYQSNTPVKGVSLFAGSTEDKELIEFFEPASPYTTIEPDPGASSTGNAIKVITTPGQSLQGIASNEFRIDDPSNLEVSFSIKFPTTKVPGGGLTAFLLGEYDQIIPMHLTGFKRDTWSYVKVSVPSETVFQTGSYQIVLMQTLPVANAPWWIEDLSVKTASVKWQARSYGQDAWSDPEERWQSIGRTLNEEQGGLVFEEPGNGLQVRAQTFRQDAQIHNFKVVPQYATLGRFVFEQNAALRQGSSVEVSKSPGSASTAPTEGHAKQWTNFENIKVNDSNYATDEIGDFYSNWLYAFNYGYGIPSTATITGIKIQIARKGTYGAGGGSFDRELYMLKNGSPVGNNFANTELRWPTSVATATYGGNGQLFGYPWTPAIINNSTTGVGLTVSGGKQNTAEVNWIGMTVYYTLPA